MADFWLIVVFWMIYNGLKWKGEGSIAFSLNVNPQTHNMG